MERGEPGHPESLSALLSTVPERQTSPCRALGGRATSLRWAPDRRCVVCDAKSAFPAPPTMTIQRGQGTCVGAWCNLSGCNECVAFRILGAGDQPLAVRPAPRNPGRKHWTAEFHSRGRERRGVRFVGRPMKPPAAPATICALIHSATGRTHVASRDSHTGCPLPRLTRPGLPVVLGHLYS